MLVFLIAFHIVNDRCSMASILFHTLEYLLLSSVYFFYIFRLAKNELPRLTMWRVIYMSTTAKGNFISYRLSLFFFLSLSVLVLYFLYLLVEKCKCRLLLFLYSFFDYFAFFFFFFLAIMMINMIGSSELLQKSQSNKIIL